MILPIKTYHLKRYKDIASLLIKHGRADLAQAIQMDENLPQEPGASAQAVSGDPEQLTRDLESLGPTFIKLGQLLSTRSDLLPQPYLDALARLQDNIEPFPFAEVEEIVSSELGVRLSKAFDDFDNIPLAAASLYRQAHRDRAAVRVPGQSCGIAYTQGLRPGLHAVAPFGGFLGDEAHVNHASSPRDV